MAWWNWLAGRAEPETARGTLGGSTVLPPTARNATRDDVSLREWIRDLGTDLPHPAVRWNQLRQAAFRVGPAPSRRAKTRRPIPRREVALQGFGEALAHRDARTAACPAG